MAGKSILEKIMNIAIWLTGIIVSLAVGSALISGTLSVPLIGVANVVAGWIVVVLTIVGVIAALIK